MQFTFRSPTDLFTGALKEYAEDKLARPVQRHKIDEETVRFDCEAAKQRDNVGLRVRFSYPGVQITVSTISADAYAAVDLAVDKLERKLNETEERRRTLARRPGRADALENEAEDLMTQDEGEALKEMGAYDAVIEA